MSKRRGATLIELLVVGSIFMAVLTALYFIHDATMAVERSVSLKVDVDREVFAAVRHVDATLRGARLVLPADWYNPQLVHHVEVEPLSVSPNGLPVFSALGIAQFDAPFTIRFQDGELVRLDTSRRFANLGTNGKVEFLRRSQGVLEMRLKVQKTGYRERTTARELTFQFCLFNQ
jgi:hypothetical protein